MSGGEIHIKWLSDDSYCDTCGTNWAEGAMVTLDGKPLLELNPHATCFGGDHWDRADVYRRIIEKMGYAVSDQ